MDGGEYFGDNAYNFTNPESAIIPYVGRPPRLPKA
jgi:hypothetical protein